MLDTQFMDFATELPRFRTSPKIKQSKLCRFVVYCYDQQGNIITAVPVTAKDCNSAINTVRKCWAVHMTATQFNRVKNYKAEKLNS